MAFTTEQNALSGTAELIITPPVGGGRYRVKNMDGSIKVYLGAAGVTSSTGFEVGAGVTTEEFFLHADEPLYAVAASATPSICILSLGI